MREPDSTNDKTLILITNHFPYGFSEAFLESEIDYLTGGFDRVIILARDVTSTGVRSGKGNFLHYRIDPQSDLRELAITAWLYLKKFRKVYGYLKDEIQCLRKQKKSISPGIILTMIHDLTKALTTSYHIHKQILQHRLTGKVTIYSYWLTSSALAATLVDVKGITIKKISRAHGGDVYEARNDLRYLSFRSSLIKNLDHIYTISENACHHLKQTVPAEYHSRISVSRLGTQNAGKAVQKNTKVLTLLSCSFMLPVKRLHLIMEALALITDLEINWIHIGDGPLKAALAEQANTLLQNHPTIRYEFRGTISNPDLLEFYRTHYIDLFINTSSSEGIPVTMMEAQSFGIPVIGPDVGGVPEIVSSSCGKLIPVDASPEIIASAIRELLSLPPDEYERLRHHAFENWQSKFNAGKNFSTFVAEILSLSHEA